MHAASSGNRCINSVSEYCDSDVAARTGWLRFTGAMHLVSHKEPSQSRDNYPIKSPIVPDVDAVFKALADPSRRVLLDHLFERDGQTLAELCAALPSMTRFGVMKHLDVLEAAGLLATQRVGRTKVHYLNPIPIREIHDRWTSKYAAAWSGSLLTFKRDLEHKSAHRRTPQRREPVG